MTFLIDTNIIAEVRKGHRCDPAVAKWWNGVAEDDSLYRAEAVGRSDDGLTAEEHDRSLYGWPRA